MIYCMTLFKWNAQTGKLVGIEKISELVLSMPKYFDK